MKLLITFLVFTIVVGTTLPGTAEAQWYSVARALENYQEELENQQPTDALIPAVDLCEWYISRMLLWCDPDNYNHALCYAYSHLAEQWCTEAETN